MGRRGNATWETDEFPRIDLPAHAANPPRPRRARVRHRGLLAGARAVGALAAVGVIAATGVGWAGYHRIAGGITTSQALEGAPASTGGDQNILIMGLDSRLDQRGQPLAPDIYDALHAGDETVGGYNANVLIVLHIPAGDGPITAISVPRDDYVNLAGCDVGSCKGKIKQAYGLAYQRTIDAAASSDAVDPAAQEQAGREAGRKAEIETVRNLLGIPIDHFIEVTMVAFFQIAQVVQPITVCLNADTADPFSGADFHQGMQQIDASQAIAFVRQRRDVNDELFTDMDRTRRQQAFIASLLSALRSGGTLSSPSGLQHLLEVARQSVAVDSRLDLPDFVKRASGFTNRDLTLYTLPITQFGRDPAGEDVNIIDVATIRAIARNLVTSDDAAAPATSTPAVPAVLDVVNATTHSGLATAVLDDYGTKGFTPGEATTAAQLAQASSIEFGPGALEAAQTLADEFGFSAQSSDAVGPNTVRLTVGDDFPADQYLTGSTTDTGTGLAATPTSSSPVSTVAATATGTAAPVPTEMSRMTASRIPCVK
ncbi:LytR family transcriptional regulator [Mycolicibacterium moriokaense]|nr:LytR family transcriptional regulator [Mycolicibacterium moriokaense]